MEIIALGVAVLVILVIQFYRNQARQRRQLLTTLQQQWGQVPDREYMDGDLRRIARYFEQGRDREPQQLILDDITWNDLGMDDIYMLINHTQSSVGEEALYRMLRTPAIDMAVLKERSRLAQLFADDAALRLRLEVCLHQIGKNQRQAFCDYISELGRQPARSNARHYIGIAVLVAALLWMIVSPYYGGLLLIVTIAFQIITYYQQKAQVESFFVCVANVVRLAQCGQEICHLTGAEAIDAYQKQLRQCVSALEPIRRKARVIVMGKSMGGSPLDLLADYLKMLVHTDLIAYNQVIGLVRQAEPAIWQTIDVLGQLECGLAIASFRQCLGIWCGPELSEISVGQTPQQIKTVREAQDIASAYQEQQKATALFLHGDDLYHPLIDRPVPNSVHAERCQLITGSNASGKSTFLKTVALSAVMAQTIYTVAGSGYRAPFYQIYSSMALKDDLIGGESYYMVEIRSLKRILDRGRDTLPVLCFVDEVLRGTNTVERIAASTQILKSMSQQNILCFAATHDGELTYLLEDHYDNGHFSETITEGDILFSYRLQPGRAVGRNALQLLGLMGYDVDVLQQARDMAERFDRTGTWSLYDEG